MWFRSESAVSISSGLIVVLAFFGDLFTPLDGVLADIAAWTPMWGVAHLARWPQMEGLSAGQAASGNLVYYELWMILVNIVAWTLIFATIGWAGTRRSTAR